MKPAILFIGICLIILLIPIGEVLILSFRNTEGNTLKWYLEVLSNTTFTKPFLNSLVVSLLTAFFSTILAFILSLSWFNSFQRQFLLLLLLLLGLAPPDIAALAIVRLSSLIGVTSSSFGFLLYGLTIYCFPFTILLLWARYYYLSPSIIVAAKDIGLKKLNITLKIILPLAGRALGTCFLLSFLLAFSEFPRSFYLSGSTNLISRYLSGQLQSGSDESVYAGSTLTILLTVFIIILMNYLLSLTTFSRKKAGE